MPLNKRWAAALFLFGNWENKMCIYHMITSYTKPNVNEQIHVCICVKLKYSFFFYWHCFRCFLSFFHRGPAIRLKCRISFNSLEKRFYSYFVVIFSASSINSHSNASVPSQHTLVPLLSSSSSFRHCCVSIDVIYFMFELRGKKIENKKCFLSPNKNNNSMFAFPLFKLHNFFLYPSRCWAHSKDLRTHRIWFVITQSTHIIFIFVYG